MKTVLAAVAIVLAGYAGYLYLTFDTMDSCEALNRQLVQRILQEKAVEKPKNFLTSSLVRSIAEVPAEIFIKERTGENQIKCAHRLLTGGFHPTDMLE